MAFDDQFPLLASAGHLHTVCLSHIRVAALLGYPADLLKQRCDIHDAESLDWTEHLIRVLLALIPMLDGTGPELPSIAGTYLSMLTSLLLRQAIGLQDAWMW